MIIKSCFLITGGSGGIGEALSKIFFEKNIIPIIIFNKNKKKANEIAKKYNGFSLRIDMTNENSINNSISKIKTILGNDKYLRGLILGASKPPEIKLFSNLDSKDFFNQFSINVFGSHLLLVKLIKNFFREKKSATIIGILSNSIGNKKQKPTSGMGAYVLAKQSLENMLELSKVEYPWLKINTIKPKFTDTNMLKAFGKNYVSFLKQNNKIMPADKVASMIWKKIDK